jgi:hypothetical protein
LAPVNRQRPPDIHLSIGEVPLGVPADVTFISLVGLNELAWHWAISSYARPT